MFNVIVREAANTAAGMMKQGFLPEFSIMSAAASCCVSSKDIAHELGRRAAKTRALNKKKKQMEQEKKQKHIDKYWERMRYYEN